MIPTQEILQELLDYNPETGRLTWKPRGRHWFKSDRIHRSWNGRYSNQAAGCVEVNKRGYRRRLISILGKRHKEHKIIWIYMTGSLPSGEIDHKDQDATNNRWCNLRNVSRQENSRNQSRKSNNKSGMTGVSWATRREKWIARVVRGGELLFDKSFSTKEEAIDAVLQARAKLGFSRRHGTVREYQ